MHKVIVDTNVVISGVLYGGTPKIILEAWLRGEYSFCISPELKTEILDKLRNKFLLSENALHSIQEMLDKYSEKYVPRQKVTICKDLNDNFLLELAEESGADYLVSGDKILLDMKNHKGTKIISPREFMEILA